MDDHVIGIVLEELVYGVLQCQTFCVIQNNSFCVIQNNSFFVVSIKKNSEDEGDKSDFRFLNYLFHLVLQAMEARMKRRRKTLMKHPRYMVIIIIISNEIITTM